MVPALITSPLRTRFYSQWDDAGPTRNWVQAVALGLTDPASTPRNGERVAPQSMGAGQMHRPCRGGCTRVCLLSRAGTCKVLWLSDRGGGRTLQMCSVLLDCALGDG